MLRLYCTNLCGAVVTCGGAFFYSLEFDLPAELQADSLTAREGGDSLKSLKPGRYATGLCAAFMTLVFSGPPASATPMVLYAIPSSVDDERVLQGVARRDYAAKRLTSQIWEIAIDGPLDRESLILDTLAAQTSYTESPESSNTPLVTALTDAMQALGAGEACFSLWDRAFSEGCCGCSVSGCCTCLADDGGIDRPSPF